MAEELRPCPFCGGAAYRQETIEHYPASEDGPAGSYSAWFNIGCNTCGIEVAGKDVMRATLEVIATLPAGAKDGRHG